MDAVGGRWQSARLVGALVSVALFAGCAAQRIRQEAEGSIRAGNYEQALATLDAGLRDHPSDPGLRATAVQARTDAVTRLSAEAAAARADGRLDVAALTLKRSLALQPGNARTQALLADLVNERTQRQAVADAEALLSQQKAGDALRIVREALKTNPRFPELVALQRRIEAEQRQAQWRASQSGLEESRPISLDFRDANLRTVLDVVSRNSGVNFVLDRDIRPEARVTIYVKSARVEDVLDLIASTNQLAKKVLDGKTVLIYPNTAEKQREHQEQVLRVFYLSSADAKGAAAFLRSMLRIREPFIDERSNMVAVRDSQENIQLAERLIALYDSSDPEVLLEVEVIEIRRSRLTELGVKLPDSFSLTVLPVAGDEGLTLASVRGLTRDRIGFSIGGATVNLRRETGDFNTLANPRIRVKNKEKAKVMIGDKIPVVSATTGQNGFVSDSINYLDVGLKLDVEPTVSIDDEVAIRVALEVSSLGSAVKTASGSLAYQIGTRNASTLLRLRDGETQLLAGLISSEERSDASRLPGIGDLPVVGRLFSNTRDDNNRTELVLSITPRVLRNARRPDIAEAELWIGTEAQPKLRPVGGLRPSAAADKPASSTTAGLPSRGAERGASVPATSLRLAMQAPTTAASGDTVEVVLQLEADEALRGLPITLSFDSERLEFTGVEEGDFFRRDGAGTNFTRGAPSPGRIGFGALRRPATGAQGKGTVAVVRFRALAPGEAEVSVVNANPVGVTGPVGVPRLPVAKIVVR